jgi:hypothetical protein
MKTKLVVHCKKEQFDVYIGRPSQFGNPFVIGKDGTRAEVIEKFRQWFMSRIAKDEQFKNAVQALNGKVLGCWCAPARCHGDVITEWLSSL